MASSAHRLLSALRAVSLRAVSHQAVSHRAASHRAASHRAALPALFLPVALLGLGLACAEPVAVDDDDDSAGDDDDDSVGDDDDSEATLLPAGSSVWTVEQVIDGAVVEREVLIEAPADLGTEPLPVLVALHGATGQNDGWRGPLGPLVAEGAFVGVYPQGHLGFWALGPEPSTADDVAFLSEVMERLAAQENLDADRFFALGSSNGAGMAHRMAIETDWFAGIAALVTSLTVSHQPDADSAPLSVLQIMGQADELIPYEGGSSPTGHTFLPAEESAAVWAAHAGCDGPGGLTEEANGDRWLEWTGCAEGRRVLHIGVAGAGHGLPMDFQGGIHAFIWGFLSGL